jgi:hypothetical protein
MGMPFGMPFGHARRACSGMPAERSRETDRKADRQKMLDKYI